MGSRISQEPRSPARAWDTPADGGIAVLARPWPSPSPDLPAVSIAALERQLHKRDGQIVGALRSSELDEEEARELRRERRLLHWLLHQFREHASGRAIVNITALMRDAERLLTLSSR